MNLWTRFAPALLWVAALPLLSQNGATKSKSPANRQETKSAQTSTINQSNGERKFAQNCSRCHNPPEGFSPRISGTIVKHMRVRASLSQQDEEDILHFLNP